MTGLKFSMYRVYLWWQGWALPCMGCTCDDRVELFHVCGVLVINRVEIFHVWGVLVMTGLRCSMYVCTCDERVEIFHVWGILKRRRHNKLMWLWSLSHLLCESPILIYTLLSRSHICTESWNFLCGFLVEVLLVVVVEMFIVPLLLHLPVFTLVCFTCLSTAFSIGNTEILFNLPMESS